MTDFRYNEEANTYNDHLVNYAGELGLFKKDLLKLQEILHNQGIDIEDGKFNSLVEKLEDCRIQEDVTAFIFPLQSREYETIHHISFANTDNGTYFHVKGHNNPHFGGYINTIINSEGTSIIDNLNLKSFNNPCLFSNSKNNNNGFYFGINNDTYFFNVKTQTAHKIEGLESDKWLPNNIGLEHNNFLYSVEIRNKNGYNHAYFKSLNLLTKTVEEAVSTKYVNLSSQIYLLGEEKILITAMKAEYPLVTLFEWYEFNVRTKTVKSINIDYIKQYILNIDSTKKYKLLEALQRISGYEITSITEDIIILNLTIYFMPLSLKIDLRNKKIYKLDNSSVNMDAIRIYNKNKNVTYEATSIKRVNNDYSHVGLITLKQHTYKEYLALTNI